MGTYRISKEKFEIYILKLKASLAKARQIVSLNVLLFSFSNFVLLVTKVVEGTMQEWLCVRLVGKSPTDWIGPPPPPTTNNCPTSNTIESVVLKRGHGKRAGQALQPGQSWVVFNNIHTIP